MEHFTNLKSRIYVVSLLELTAHVLHMLGLDNQGSWFI